MEKPQGTEYVYLPSDGDKKAINKVYERLHSMVQMRNKAYSYFNNRSLTSYIDESMKRWNGYIPPRDDLALEWQSRVFNNFTRNVVINFLSKVALQMPKARFVAANQDGFQDTNRAFILDKGVEYTRRRENGEYKFFLAALESVTKGTVVAYEGFRKIRRKVQEIKKYDPVTGKVEAEEKEILDYNDCFQDVIPLEEIYFGNLWLTDIQMMPDMIWKKVMVKQAFNEEYKKYPNHKYVKPGAYSTVVETIPYYKQKEYFQLDANSVEVVSLYDRWKDRIITSANGVLLYDGPFPWTHKKYPFAYGIFEPFAIDFIYGRSLPDKIASDQDIINTLWNMMLDQSYLSIYKPLLTDDPDYINDYPLQPGRMFPVSDINHYKVMNELTGPDASHFQMLQLATKFASDNSGSILGGAGAGAQKGKMTARQALLIQEQSQQTLGLNTKMLENFQIQATRLRAQNWLQFYPVADKAEAITGKKDTKSQFLRVMRIDNTELSDGTYGTSIVKIAKDKSVLPSQHELNVEEEVAAMQGENIEVQAITPDYIRNIEHDVQIIGESSYLQSKSLKQALGNEFYQLAKQDQLINQEENTRDWVKLNDKDPDVFLKQIEAGVPAQPGPGGPPQPGQPQSGGGPQNPQITSQIIGKSPARSLEKAL